MVHYKLTYFRIRFRAETARQLFVLAGVEYEDERITRDKWPALKPQTPFGQLPVLEVDGLQIAQSHTIDRYLARKFGYAGKNPFEEALVDSLAEDFRDYRGEIKPFFMALARFAPGDKVFNENPITNVGQTSKRGGRTCSGQILRLLQAASSRGSGFAVASGLTFIDLTIAEHVATFSEHVPDFFKDFPEVTEYVAKVRSTPALEKWIQKRPASTV